MVTLRSLGLRPYQDVWEEMKRFTIERNEHTIDEVWLLEHLPVYTQGQAGKSEHVLNPRAIPVVSSDRGGQVTYHGPGQLVAYTLIDIRRRNMGVRTLVTSLEVALIDLLNGFDITAQTRCGAPGVYVNEKKIASIGLRVKNGCTYHGIALNVAMDLSPFDGINPCGYSELQMTQMKDYIDDIGIEEVSKQLSIKFIKIFD